MRISDWSSDVCSSDLTLLFAALSEWPAATGFGVDASDIALDYANENALALGLESRVELMLGDWAEQVIGQFDLILCNPPHIADSEKRSEERRVGEECVRANRYRWAQCHKKKKKKQQ